MTNYRKIQKGTLLGSNWFYVVVDTVIVNGELWLHCICDNANNIYSFSISEVLNTTDPRKWLVIDPYTAIHKQGWDYQLIDDDEEIFKAMDREIPVDVIAEVLTGQHDDRWSEELE